MNSKSSGLRTEYSPELIRTGVRGKYAKRMQDEGSNQVLIDADLHMMFPDAKAVNRALRELVAIHQKSAD